MADRHPGPSPQHPGTAQLHDPLHLLSALLGLHHRPVEPAQGGDAGGLAALALPVVLRQRQEVGTTNLNYEANAMISLEKISIIVLLTVFGVPHSKHLIASETGMVTDNRIYCSVFLVIQPSGLISNTTLYKP